MFDPQTIPFYIMPASDQQTMTSHQTILSGILYKLTRSKVKNATAILRELVRIDITAIDQFHLKAAEEYIDLTSVITTTNLKSDIGKCAKCRPNEELLRPIELKLGEGAATFGMLFGSESEKWINQLIQLIRACDANGPEAIGPYFRQLHLMSRSIDHLISRCEDKKEPHDFKNLVEWTSVSDEWTMMVKQLNWIETCLLSL